MVAGQDSLGGAGQSAVASPMGLTNFFAVPEEETACLAVDVNDVRGWNKMLH